MAKVKSEHTYYPHVVVGMIIGCVVACGFTIKIAMDNPVELDTFYMAKYQQVDHSINTILELQEKFNAKFDLAYSTEKFAMGQNSITIRLSDKSGQPVNDANVIMMLSRPDSNKYNKEMKPSHVENGNYTFGPFDITNQVVGKF